MEEQKEQPTIQLVDLLTNFTSQLTQYRFIKHENQQALLAILTMVENFYAEVSLEILAKKKILYEWFKIIKTLDDHNYRDKQTWQSLIQLKLYFEKFSNTDFSAWREIYVTLPLLSANYRQQSANALPAIKALVPSYDHILADVDCYHLSLSRAKEIKDNFSATMSKTAEKKLTTLEAEFLYERASPFLLQLSEQKRVKAAKHLEKLLLGAGLKFSCLAWIFKRYRQGSNASDKVNLFIQYLTIYLDKIDVSLNTHVPDWQRHQKSLAEHRHQLQLALPKNPTAAIKTFNKNMRQWIIELWQESEFLLGEAPLLRAKQQSTVTPIRYCLIWLGSLAKKMMVADSDIEFALLVDNPYDADLEFAKYNGEEWQKRSFYLKVLLEIFEFTIRNLGETGIGICLDNGMQPRTQSAVFGVPESILNKCIKNVIDDIRSDDIIIYNLLHAVYAHGDKTLYDRYNTKRKEILLQACSRRNTKELQSQLIRPTTQLLWHRYWALAHFKREREKNYDEYFIKKDTQPSLKIYLKLLNYLLFNLCLYEGLQVYNIASAVEGLKNKNALLAEDYLNFIQDKITWILLLRNIYYFADQENKKNVILKAQSELQKIYLFILKPFFENNLVLIEKNILFFQQAFWLSIVEAQYFSLKKNNNAQLFLLTSPYYQQEKFLPNAWVKKIFVQETINNASTVVLDNKLFFVPITDKILFHQYHALACLAKLLDVPVPMGCGIKIFYQDKTHYGWLFSSADTVLTMTKPYKKLLYWLINVANVEYSATACPWAETFGMELTDQVCSATEKQKITELAKTWRIRNILSLWKTELKILNETDLVFLKGIQEITDLLKKIEQQQGLTSENFEVMAKESITKSLSESHFTIVEKKTLPASAPAKLAAKHGQFSQSKTIASTKPVTVPINTTPVVQQNTTNTKPISWGKWLGIGK